MIRVRVYPQGSPAYDWEISDTLKDLQALVNGYIECVRLEPGLDLWINEEGRINGMDANRLTPAGVIYGPCVLARSTPEGETVGINDADAARYSDFPRVQEITTL